MCLSVCELKKKTLNEVLEVCILIFIFKHVQILLFDESKVNFDFIWINNNLTKKKMPDRVERSRRRKKTERRFKRGSNGF